MVKITKRNTSTKLPQIVLYGTAWELKDMKEIQIDWIRSRMNTLPQNYHITYSEWYDKEVKRFVYYAAVIKDNDNSLFDDDEEEEGVW